MWWMWLITMERWVFFFVEKSPSQKYGYLNMIRSILYCRWNILCRSLRCRRDTVRAPSCLCLTATMERCSIQEILGYILARALYYRSFPGMSKLSIWTPRFASLVLINSQSEKKRSKVYALWSASGPERILQLLFSSARKLDWDMKLYLWSFRKPWIKK